MLRCVCCNFPRIIYIYLYKRGYFGSFFFKFVYSAKDHKTWEIQENEALKFSQLLLFRHLEFKISQEY